MLKTATKRKRQKAKKTVSNYALTERHRKAERTPKEQQPHITLNITPNYPNIIIM